MKSCSREMASLQGMNRCYRCLLKPSATTITWEATSKSDNKSTLYIPPTAKQLYNPSPLLIHPPSHPIALPHKKRHNGQYRGLRHQLALFHPQTHILEPNTSPQLPLPQRNSLTEPATLAYPNSREKSTANSHTRTLPGPTVPSQPSLKGRIWGSQRRC